LQKHKKASKNFKSKIAAATMDVNPAAGPVVGSLTGLVAATTYKIRVRVIIGSTITDCGYTTATTKP
jgi:hypothetical protein